MRNARDINPTAPRTTLPRSGFVHPPSITRKATCKASASPTLRCELSAIAHYGIRIAPAICLHDCWQVFARGKIVLRNPNPDRVTRDCRYPTCKLAFDRRPLDRRCTRRSVMRSAPDPLSNGPPRLLQDVVTAVREN